MNHTPYDLLVHNAEILTMDPRRPRARWAACVGDRIAAVGEGDGPSARESIDAGGATVIPGFHDAHNHMAWYGLSLSEIDVGVEATHALADLYAAVSDRAQRAAPDEWIVCSGYDQNFLGSHPTRDDLDRAAGGRPVWVKHRSGHMCVVNSPVLETLGFDRSAPDVPGGHIATDSSGRPTGLLQEEAQNLVNALVLPYSVEALTQAIGRASQQYARQGLTSVVEAGIGGGWIGKSPIEVAAYQRAREHGLLITRVQLMVASPVLHRLTGHHSDEVDLGLDLGIRTGFGDDWLSVGPMKIFTDGSLVGHTAAVCESYSERADDVGLLLADREQLIDTMVRAHRSGWSVAAHAIGDRAIDTVLDAIAAAQKVAPRPQARHRIEHFGISRPDQVHRAAALGVTPVPQGRFATELGDGMLEAVGSDRASMLYRQRSLLKVGLTLPGSSDRPVVDGAPLLGIHDMVNRTTASGRPFNQDEAVTVEEALRAYTYGSAYAAGQEHRKGTITRGKLADLVFLSRNPLSADPKKLAEIEVTRTVVGGVTVHS